MNTKSGFEPGNRRAQAAVGVLLLLSGGLFYYLQSIISVVLTDIDMLLSSDPSQGVGLAGRLLLWLVVFSGAIAVTIGFYLWGLSLRVQRSGRYPPSGMPVAFRTRIRTAEQAARMAASCRWAAVLLVLQPALGIWIWFRLTGGAL